MLLKFYQRCRCCCLQAAKKSKKQFVYGRKGTPISDHRLKAILGKLILRRLILALEIKAGGMDLRLELAYPEFHLLFVH